MAIESVVKTLREVNAVMEHGDAKYGKGAWLRRKTDFKGERDKHLAAMARHMQRFLEGQTMDSDSGEAALAHVAARCLMALEYDQRLRGV